MSADNDASLTAKVVAWLVGALAALVGVVWGSVKGKLSKHDTHIEKLYENAEKDRALVRDLHDTAMTEVRSLHDRTMTEIRTTHTDLLDRIAEIKR